VDRSKELEDTVRRMYQAMESNDFSSFEASLSHSPQARMIGTDPAEWWGGYEKISDVTRLQLKEMQGLRIAVGELEVFTEGDVGWFADQPRWIMEDGTEIPLRFTGVFHRESGAWKLVQGHASIGIANEDAVGFEMTT
jgi:SnoaL-like domain